MVRTGVVPSALLICVTFGGQGRAEDDQPLATEGASTCAGTTSCGGSANPYACCGTCGNCTWWAWHAACEVWGVHLPGWTGDACTWLGHAQAAGYPTSSTPSVGSIAVRTSACPGHVAFVIDVNATQVKVSEQSCFGFGGSCANREHWYDRSYFQGYFSKPCASGPTITAQPGDRAACPGNDVQLVTDATGRGQLRFRWQKNGVELNNDGHYLNVTGKVLGFANLNTSDTGHYRCVIDDDCGRVYTRDAYLNVWPSTQFTAQPIDRIACTGGSVQFSVSGTGGDPLAYRWQKNGVELNDDGHFFDVHGTTLTIQNVNAGDAGSYRCVLDGACGRVYSNGGSLTVGSPVLISTQPEPQTACAGSSAFLSVLAEGTNLAYRWQHEGADIADGGAYFGADTDTLWITDLDAGLAGDYRCVVSGLCGSPVTTTVAALEVLDSTVIVQHPSALVACSDATATFTAAAAGAGTFRYQWQKDGVDLTDGGNISGTSTPRLQLLHPGGDHAGGYRCVIGAACGTVTTEEAALNVRAGTAITRQPRPVIAPLGAMARMSVAAVGSGTTFQWYKADLPLVDNEHLKGTNEPVLAFLDVAAEDAGGYACEVRGPCGSKMSEPAYLTIGAGGRGELGPMYEVVPLDINSGGLQSAESVYAVNASTGQAGGVGAIATPPAGLHDGFWPAAYATLPAVVIPPDFDGDGDVDGLDLAHFLACATGPELGPPSGGCEDTDLDNDGDADQSDFGLFQTCMTGTNVPSDPACFE